MIGVVSSTLVPASAAAFIGLLFTHAAWLKASDFHVFQGRVRDYRVLPAAIDTTVSGAIVGAEAAVPVMLLIPGQAIYGAVLAMALLAVYAMAMTINLLRGRRHIRCGCGAAPQPLSWSLVVRNAFLIASTGLMLLPGRSSLSLLEMVVVAGVGLTSWVTFIMFETVVSNYIRVRSIAAGRSP
jgi:hypothetical protein